MTSETISNGNITNEEEFTRENIEKNKQIKMVDTDPETGLSLFSYIHCSPTDSDLIKRCRGVVYKDDQLIMKGFPYTYEFCEKENLQEIKDNVDFETCSFYDSHEGSVIRMFYFGGKWYLSTNRKFDAFKSKWASKDSFGSFFTKALQNEFETNEKLMSKITDYNKETDSGDVIKFFADQILDKDKQYMFLLLNNKENRIVCEPSENAKIFHVGTFVDGNLSMSEDICIPYPVKHNFENIDQLLSYVDKVNFKQLQGVIVFAPNNLQFKIFNIDYQYLYNVRGNEPSIKFRYIQVRMNKDYNESLHYLYPDFSKQFEDYENHIYDIAGDITNAYIERFIKKNYVTVPIEEFGVIRKCHNWHVENRVENKISINKVIEILNDEPATNINRMIKRKIVGYYKDSSGNTNTTSGNVSNFTTTNQPRVARKKQYVSILTNKPVTIA